MDFGAIAQGISGDFSNNMGTAAAFGCLPDLEGKLLLLKVSPTSDTGLEEIDLELTWKPHPGGLHLIRYNAA